MKYFTSSVLSFVVVLGCSGALLAAEIESNPYSLIDERSAVVKYSDLNPADSEDAQILLHRVESAASALCKRPGDFRQLAAMRDRKHCVEESYKNALVVINRQTGIDTEAVAARAAGSRELVAE
jgi:UrcA family protein